MDKRIKYLVGLDTETCNGLVDENGKMDLSQSFVYDIGWQITDKRGKVYKQRSFVVDEVFFGMADVMTSAYYAEKIPKYLEDIAKGSRIVDSFYNIRKTLLNDMKEYGCDTVFAHNCRFDLNALNNTERYLTKSKYRYFFPYNTVLWDTLKMSKVITTQKGYRRFCEDNGYMTAHKVPRPRATAEVLYRYISGENTFEENHTGLEDVEIETKILAECFKKHKKMNKLLFE